MGVGGLGESMSRREMGWLRVPVPAMGTVVRGWRGMVGMLRGVGCGWGVTLSMPSQVGKETVVVLKSKRVCRYGQEMGVLGITGTK